MHQIICSFARTGKATNSFACIISRHARLAVYFFTILLPGVLVSCAHQDNGPEDKELIPVTDTITLSSFKKIQKISFQNAGIAIPGENAAEMAVTDTFLLVSDLRDTCSLHVISTRSNKELSFIIKRGDGKNECLNVANILKTADKDIVWLYDITLGKFMKIDLRKAAGNQAYVPEEEFVLKGNAKAVKSPCWINDSTFAGCSYLLNDCRYLYFNKSSVILKKVGRLPPMQKSWPKENKTGLSLAAGIYTANLKNKPGSSLFVAAYNSSSRIEFYDDDKLNKLVRGPDLFNVFYSFQSQANVTLPVQTSKTIYSHMKLQVDKDFVFILYSGSGNFQSCGQKILILDWQGNPVKLLLLDSYYCFFTIEKNEKQYIVYSINQNTGTIVNASFSI